ncbi:class I glutamine amidotransferase-like protein [Polychytrium aggregatum]|uniref:class I glutamine amidotransferase-like protein n=1 Tax=Polychytrium aggregatum TaxID=110093 RepID=UPI0022FE42A2|nr:class I glutamine amidotransferase-like protein [Polychytrium aggregatum]KAI9203402.1 class I glutamine amidotransferase-like protein [Polychytrium aggregatum]
MAKNILFVLTSHSELGSTGHKTGWYLPEVAHPYYVLAHHKITWASPKGGATPMDPGSADAFKADPECAKFLVDPVAQAAVNNTVQLSTINVADYDAVVVPGGHGPVFDLAYDAESARIISGVYERGGVVGAICHGPAALINVKLSNGSYLVNGKKLTAFSNAEEDAVSLTAAMPYLLEDELVKHGGIYEKAGALWGEHVVVDGQLVTGQNPSSGHAFGKAISQLLQ